MNYILVTAIAAITPFLTLKIPSVMFRFVIIAIASPLLCLAGAVSFSSLGQVNLVDFVISGSDSPNGVIGIVIIVIYALVVSALSSSVIWFSVPAPKKKKKVKRVGGN